jgi:hypothetical protein
VKQATCPASSLCPRGSAHQQRSDRPTGMFGNSLYDGMTLVPFHAVTRAFPLAENRCKVSNGALGTERSAALLNHDPSASAVSSRGSVAASFFPRVLVITTTLIRTNTVPRIVRGPSASPPRKYPTTTATTGFTYA